jgi:hypothetical protein
VVAQLEQAISNLTQEVEKHRASGNARRLREAEQALQARQEWLEQAQRALEEFSG